MPIRNNVFDFKADLQAFSKATHRRLEQVVRMVIFELLRMIIVRTPVDTGRAAGSWMVGTSVDSYVLPESAHMTRDEAAKQAMEKVRKIDFTNLNTVYWIYNNLPYIRALEFGEYPKEPKRGSYVKGVGYVIKTVDGFSEQAPAGMVRISIADLEVKIDTIVRRAAETR